jgi:hypothetical protein
MPTFISFETPFPGTPLFQAIVRGEGPRMLPDVLLQDCNAYTLVTQPAHATPRQLIDAYRTLHREVFSLRRAFRKLASDVPAFLRRGFAWPALIDAGEVLFDRQPLCDDRTYIGGTDKPYPERVPLSDADFTSEVERRSIMEPWRITDAGGKVLPRWAADRDAGVIDLQARRGSAPRERRLVAR